mmetsp:Transcript_48361/g.138135  ORF Transcript_48361/g.138135 Transcript_48361/m.138135 type:complete len:182 (-) Transcript_48361:1626-2171(-)
MLLYPSGWGPWLEPTSVAASARGADRRPGLDRSWPCSLDAAATVSLDPDDRLLLSLAELLGDLSRAEFLGDLVLRADVSETLAVSLIDPLQGDSDAYEASRLLRGRWLPSDEATEGLRDRAFGAGSPGWGLAGDGSRALPGTLDSPADLLFGEVEPMRASSGEKLFFPSVGSMGAVRLLRD